MKDFFRNTTDLIIKQVISQLGMTLFGLAISLTLIQMAGKSTPWLLAGTLLATALYVFLIYVHTWEFGAKEKIKIDGGRMKFEPLKGLYVALVSNSLNILLSVLLCVGYYVYDFTTMTPNWAGQLYAVVNMIIRALDGMYLSAVVYFFPTAELTPPYIFLLLVLPAVIASCLAYYFGATNKRLFPAKNTPNK